jgi:asparagine synthase (glutamine-hydrolysing)
MCGFAGIARRSPDGIELGTLARMGASIRHRGPDGFGFFRDQRVGMVHLRLSIIDLEGGAQPLTNEDGQVVVVYNGEIYNYVELREELRQRGHRFRTASDTEVLVHGYEEWGAGLLPRLNGQFAFVLYDRRDDTVLLVRDRFGVRPLFFSVTNGDLIFGSEVKAILASGEVAAAIDPEGFDQVFTSWAALAPRTPFCGISSLEPGSFAVWRGGRLLTTRYYQLLYPAAGKEDPEALEQLDELLRSGVSYRMRADVPVGGYLSGGLDSSITCALATAASPHRLRTFSITFDDPSFDESAYQREVAASLGSLHVAHGIGPSEIASVFPDVIRHAETPLVRTAPAPLFVLSRVTRDAGIKVVLTGEGADELFLGYDLFKETAVRLFCLRQPTSTRRPLLFDRLYPYLTRGARAGEFWRRFFLSAGPPADPLFSHLPRFRVTSAIKEFYGPEFRAGLAGFDALQVLRESLPDAFFSWSPLHRAAYLEMTTLLSSYLLSSQGDRMSLAHGVEGRYPFLDHRLFEFAAALPARSKLRTLREKDILRRWARRVVPETVTSRTKQPYRAPDAPAFFGPGAPAYVDELLAPRALIDAGVFAPAAVAGLVERCRAGRAIGFRENQALVAILSTQLWHHTFMRDLSIPVALPIHHADVLLDEAAVIAADP